MIKISTVLNKKYASDFLIYFNLLNAASSLNEKDPVNGQKLIKELDSIVSAKTFYKVYMQINRLAERSGIKYFVIDSYDINTSEIFIRAVNGTDSRKLRSRERYEPIFAIPGIISMVSRRRTKLKDSRRTDELSKEAASFFIQSNLSATK